MIRSIARWPSAMLFPRLSLVRLPGFRMIGSEMSTTWPSEFDALIRSHCRFIHPSAAIEPDELIASLGADSLEIVELIVELEDQFGIVFTDYLLTPDVFATPGTIWTAVELLRHGKNAPATGALSGGGHSYPT
jgi:acyl carrier protein